MSATDAQLTNSTGHFFCMILTYLQCPEGSVQNLSHFRSCDGGSVMLKFYLAQRIHIHILSRAPLFAGDVLFIDAIMNGLVASRNARQKPIADFLHGPIQDRSYSKPHTQLKNQGPKIRCRKKSPCQTWTRGQFLVQGDRFIHACANQSIASVRNTPSNPKAMP